jgi:hypothetical protein
MTLPEMFTVALKVGSLSGFAAFVWQLLKAWDEARARLRVMTTRECRDVLRLRVEYRAKTAHRGLYARARVLRPKRARLSAMERPARREDLPGAIRRTAKQLQADRAVRLRLALQEGSDTLYVGELALSVVPSERGKVLLEIWADGRWPWLTRRRLAVSPAD